jgi:uncharacterized membrane-anchored protein YjiN (DUF445 family)
VAQPRPAERGVTAADVRRLRRMKLAAASFLAVAAVVFAATYGVPGLKDNGYVRAAAEAAMVGGLADWFAVTALFRRPLGLPIPHTALIPTRKDALAESLGDFMTSTFLTDENVVAHLRRIDIVGRTARWLREPANSRRLGTEVAVAASALTDAVRDEELSDLLLATARIDVARRAYAPLVGRLLETTVADEGHQALTDIALTSTHDWLRANRIEIVGEAKLVIEQSGVLAWLLTTTRRVDRGVEELTDYIGYAARDRRHPLRRLIDRFLMTVARELQTDEALGERVNEEALRVLNDPALREWLIEVVDGALTSLRETLKDPASKAVERLAAAISRYAERVASDPELFERLQVGLDRVSSFAVDRYSDVFTSLVVNTVADWDGKQTARRIEVFAGRDLQFIRINGTVVGALAGIAIHAVSLAL